MSAPDLVTVRQHDLMSSETCKHILQEATNYKLVESAAQTLHLPQEIYDKLKPRYYK